MKVVLSRKGFDSKNGGVASPIFGEIGDQTLYSLPIPSERSACGYEEIAFKDSNLLELIRSLRQNRPMLPNTPHLDPDLFPATRASKHADWRPVFGQSGAQERQLQNMGVDHSTNQNDRTLFLFFGWYKEVEAADGGYRYRRPQCRDVHALFGWLQTAEKVLLRNEEDRRILGEKYPWIESHPHVACDYYDAHGPNAVYIAPKPGTSTDRLVLCGHETELPAAGMFAKFEPAIHTLTKAGATKSVWRVPTWLYRDGQPRLGMHTKQDRWTAIEGDPGHMRLQTVGIGQEFVLDTDDYDQGTITCWIREIVQAGQKDGDRIPRRNSS